MGRSPHAAIDHDALDTDSNSNNNNARDDNDDYGDGGGEYPIAIPHAHSRRHVILGVMGLFFLRGFSARFYGKTGLWTILLLVVCFHFAVAPSLARNTVFH